MEGWGVWVGGCWGSGLRWRLSPLHALFFPRGRRRPPCGPRTLAGEALVLSPICVSPHRAPDPKFCACGGPAPGGPRLPCPVVCSALSWNVPRYSPGPWRFGLAPTSLGCCVPDGGPVVCEPHPHRWGCWASGQNGAWSARQAGRGAVPRTMRWPPAWLLPATPQAPDPRRLWSGSDPPAWALSCEGPSESCWSRGPRAPRVSTQGGETQA